LLTTSFAIISKLLYVTLALHYEKHDYYYYYYCYYPY
jgi:hypothetical protein